ncbi:Zn-dependent hydrolase (plasmid) [Streptomyces sp. NBC_01724]|uniref:Zn-dependent hydrolase n=1 Tax=Streptomyces sp. NBC_01724 TaxID=2975922 RepID=UPI002E3031B1|nr:Zn-dependent hydrolase [Streptomyces sp. NBC_01724]
MSVQPVDRARLLRRLTELAQVGRSASGGVTRPGFSPADLEARRYMVREAENSGLPTAVDAAGNLWLGPRPHPGTTTLVLGSHLDTVVDAGPLDGVYGVVSALEAVENLASLDLAHPVTAVAFANEEGALHPQPFWGSLAASGQLPTPAATPTAYDGTLLRDAITRAGGNLDAIDQARLDPGQLLAYLELHIEQGPVLERERIPIGIVDAIVGRVQLEVDFMGTAAHAGTTPMPGRSDALAAAAEIVLAVEGLPAAGWCQVATVGRLEAAPNSPNTIAGLVRLTVDVRDADEAQLHLAADEAVRRIESIAQRRTVKASCTRAASSRPVLTDAALRRSIVAAADLRTVPTLPLTSGAGHDAQMMAALTPTAMIFVPSIGGVSHVPHEDTDPDDLVQGAQLLQDTALTLASRPGSLR